MNDLSWTCGPATLPDTLNAISLPDSVDGPTPCVSPDGLTTDRFGQPRAHASLSVSPAKKRALKIRGISGRNLLASSVTQDLQRSLESRLRELLTGSVSCEVVWRPWVTPWGAFLLRPRARARTITGIAIGLWPTVVASDDNKTPAAYLAMKQRMGEREGMNANRTAITSPQVMIKAIVLGLWPTATTPSGGQVNPEGTTLSGIRPDGTKTQVTLQNVVIAIWSTIRASDGEKGGPNISFGAGGSPPPSQLSTISSTSNAPTENGGGSLHPEFAGWEMGYLPEWINCAPSATRSTRVRRRPLSKRS